MEYVDYYGVLGIPRSAPQEEVTRAFKKLARANHPDVNKAPGAEERFKQIVEAHEVLKDPESRAKYDRFGSAWNRVGPTPPPQAGKTAAEEFSARGFSEIFEAMFGKGGRGGFKAPPPPSAPIDGDDVDVRLQLTLEEALEGGDREVRLSTASEKSRTLRVTLPKGVRDGQKMRLKGQGQKGRNGGAAGDLFLHMELVPHARFTLEGDDLRTVVNVPAWTAVLGGEVKVQTLDNQVMVKVPAGSSTGRKIRLRHKGWPTKEGRGDLYAEVKVVVPKAVSDKERALWEKLAAVSDFTGEE